MSYQTFMGLVLLEEAQQLVASLLYFPSVVMCYLVSLELLRDVPYSHWLFLKINSLLKKIPFWMTNTL